MQFDPRLDPSRPNAEAIQGFIISKVAEELRVNPAEVDLRAQFASFGLDSIVIFNITGDLAAWLQRDLESTLLWEYPTIEAVARFLAADAGAACEAV
jgi:acyl carrier protein